MVIVLSGTNEFLLSAELDKLVSAFLAKYGEMGLERLDGAEAEYDRLRESLQSLPFLASRKMVVLRAPSANKQFIDNAEKLLGELPDTTDAIIIEPKLDKRLSYYKFLKKQADFREYAALDLQGLSRWLVEAAKARGGRLSSNDARFLVERVGLNQQMLSSELDKLLLYEPNVTRATIELLTEPTPQSSIFELIDAALAGNIRRATSLYEEQRTLKVEPQQIIAMLAWQLNILAIIQAAGDRSPEQVAKEAKLSPYVVRKSAGIARSISRPSLKRLIADLLALDLRLKREPIDPDAALQNYILELGI